jgi:intracellular multiplication protein IcmT
MAHWRDSYRQARFFFLDARAGIAVLLVLVHIRPWTIALAVVAIGLSWWTERIGLGVSGALRAVRDWFAGPIRPALPAHKIRQQVDYGRRTLTWDREPETGEHAIVAPSGAPTPAKH